MKPLQANWTRSAICASSSASRSFIAALDPEKTDKKSFKIEDEGLELVNRLRQREIARRCTQWINDKVEIRSVRQANLLHGKLYHINDGHRDHAILGSSNFTRRCLGLSSLPNIELNLIVDSDRDRTELKGSRLRNPAIAAVLHELNWAETKGSGIHSMRRLVGAAGLPLPEFASDRQKNEFKVTLFLHHLLTEDDYAWLKALAGEGLTGEEAKALIYARETGIVDNTACRDFSGLDTLQASSLLRRLRDRGLLAKQGAGSRTYYTLAVPRGELDLHPKRGELPLEGGNRLAEGGKQTPQGGKRTLPGLPPELTARLPQPRQRLGEAALRALIRDLCRWQALRGEELATLLHKDLKYLRNKHLTEMVQIGELAFLYPESPNHALQAYKLPDRNQGR